MATDIVPAVFDSDEFGSIRAMDDGGDIWFAAHDIAKALGYRDSDKLTRNLYDDEKGTQNVGTPGGLQTLQVISEPGLYHALTARRSGAVKNQDMRGKVERFQRWVTHDVLPSIRRDGGYMAAPAEETPEETMARALFIAKRAIERRDARISEQASQIEEMRPKALFADAVAASDGTCLVGELAKMMTQAGHPIGQNRLFKRMRDDGFLGKSGCNRNVPLQRFVEAGLFKIKETAITHADGHVTLSRTTKVTGKGQRYFLDRYCKGGDAA